jgi:heat shock protein HslJ
MLTLSFADDGSISGSTGCNLFRGAFTHDAPSGALTLEGVASTRKACPNPEAATQEQAFLEALRSATSVRLDRDRLELRSDDGALQVSLRTATA